MDRTSKLKYLLIPLILLMVALFLFSGVKLLESVLVPDNDAQVEFQTRTIVRDGVSYYPRHDIEVILLVGTDADGKIESSGSYNNKASADMVALLVFDEATEEFRILGINRDTMMDIPVLGINGRQAGMVYAQLATSHNYGSGLSDSCENTEKAVSNFLYGLNIDYYFCMNMDGIAVLNDSVGGVEVSITEDFSQVDPSLIQGTTVVLNGEQAYSFVRSRAGVGSQLNVSRMERQKQYLEGFAHSLNASSALNDMFYVDLWEDISEFTQTDCSATVLNKLASEYGDYRFGGFVTLEGENILGEKYYEFYPDQGALDQVILDLFYTRVER